MSNGNRIPKGFRGVMFIEENECTSTCTKKKSNTPHTYLFCEEEVKSEEEVFFSLLMVYKFPTSPPVTCLSNINFEFSDQK
jgi:hypothetical protein